jgi:hypothetical protein
MTAETVVDDPETTHTPRQRELLDRLAPRRGYVEAPLVPSAPNQTCGVPIFYPYLGLTL